MKRYSIKITSELTDEKPNRIIYFEELKPKNHYFYSNKVEEIPRKVEEIYLNLKQNTQSMNYKISNLQEYDNKNKPINNSRLEKIISDSETKLQSNFTSESKF